MGASQVQSLIGRWHSIIGQEVHGGRGERREERREIRREERGGNYGNVVVEPIRQEPWGERHHHHERERWLRENPGGDWEERERRRLRWEREHPGGIPFSGAEALVGAWYSIVGADASAFAGFPPRNALIDAPGPTRGGREVLPMSTGVAILPTQSAQITARPQRVAFRPERVFISAAGTLGGAADWVVNDIKIGNRSQFSQSGDVPGDMFGTAAIDGFVSFETAQTAMDVVMVVTYIGVNESGNPFYGSIVGTAAI